MLKNVNIPTPLMMQEPEERRVHLYMRIHERAIVTRREREKMLHYEKEGFEYFGFLTKTEATKLEDIEYDKLRKRRNPPRGR